MNLTLILKPKSIALISLFYILMLIDRLALHENLLHIEFYIRLISSNTQDNIRKIPYAR